MELVEARKHGTPFNQLLISFQAIDRLCHAQPHLQKNHKPDIPRSSNGFSQYRQSQKKHQPQELPLWFF